MFVGKQFIRCKQAREHLIFFNIKLSDFFSAFKEGWCFSSTPMCSIICLCIGFCKCAEGVTNLEHLAEWIFTPYIFTPYKQDCL